MIFFSLYFISNFFFLFLFFFRIPYVNATKEFRFNQLKYGVPALGNVSFGSDLKRLNLLTLSLSHTHTHTHTHTHKKGDYRRNKMVGIRWLCFQQSSSLFSSSRSVMDVMIGLDFNKSKCGT